MESLCVKDGSSLTCLAADEPEPYCLNDGEKVWLGELEGAGACLWMREGGEGRGWCCTWHGGCVHLLHIVSE